MLNSGDPEREARKVFNANFPASSLGTTGSPSMTFNLRTDEERGENIVTVTGSTQVPTTFMRLGSIEHVNVDAMAEARRRMVDLSLILDVSSSIGSRWAAVRDASRAFVEAFDPVHDRLSLITYGNGARVLVADAIQPRIQSERDLIRHSADSSGWQHRDGRRVVSRMG